MKFWTLGIAICGLALVGTSTQARAQRPAAQKQQAGPQPDVDVAEGPGPWMARIRGYDFGPAGHSNPFNYLGISFQANDVLVGQKIGYEGDVSYFFKKWLALELSVSGPMENEVTLYGGGPIGSFTQEPVSLILQYHYQVPKMPVNAYVGVGVDYSHVTSINFNAGGGNPISVNRNMTGFAYQIGFDIAVAQGFYVNFDFRHMQLATNLTDINTGKLMTDANMTPNFYSIGLGYRF